MTFGLAVLSLAQPSTTQAIEVVDPLTRYDWDVSLAREIMMAESAGDPKAENPEWHYNSKGEKICQGSFGLFQIACIHSSNPMELLDPETNIEVAYKIYKQEGWDPWGVCHNGKVDCY